MDLLETLKKHLEARPDLWESTDATIEKMRADKNNFSYWYPKVKDCGIKQPKSVIIKVPTEITKLFLEDTICKEENHQKFYEWVRNSVMPFTKDLSLFVFIKNGTFSDKFGGMDSCLCRNDVHEITSHASMIMYNSAVLGAGGNTELIVRERITSDESITPTIYKGLPFRAEFRVFYDFTEGKIVKLCNYWDYDYVFPHLWSVTDKIVFREYYANIKDAYNEHKEKVYDLVEKHMKGVDLEGVWSVDILYDDIDFWLIDMAIAEKSAYWREEK